MAWMREPVTRRRFLAGTTAAVAAGLAGAVWRPDRLLRRGGGTEAARAYCMAMHVHACFSEGSGSMEAQLVQAVEAGVDVLWWTEHDQRMNAHGYRQWVHFDGLTEREDDRVWTWRPVTAGKPSRTRAEFGGAEASPRDAGGRSLLLAAESTGSYARHALRSKADQDLIRTSLDGQSIEIDLRPVSVSDTAFVSVDLVTSYRPARNGRPAGTYTLSYRVGGGRTPGSMVAREDMGIITLDVPTGEWTRVTLAPAQDLGALWPGVDGRDAGLFEVRLTATTMSGGEASAYFDGLHFGRTRNGGQTPLSTQRELTRLYEPQFPTVRQIQSLELSMTTPHLGWYGGRLKLPDHPDSRTTATGDPADAEAAVRMVHGAGGVASYNHMFGTSKDPVSEAAQEKARRAKAAELVANRAVGCDLVEVGYRVRGGCTLERHVSVWDTCSRNAVFLTGTGVSDDHNGEAWLEQELNFVTWVWAASNEVDDLVEALRRGRAYFGDPARFRGRLDLLVDEAVPMGAVSVSDRDERRLGIRLDALPDGGTVEIVRGDVDLAGPRQVDPVLSSATLDQSDFDEAGVASVPVDTTASRFVRVVVKARDGLPVAFSNPVWLLRSEPRQGIPAARRV
jgi:hypothetical protein